MTEHDWYCQPLGKYGGYIYVIHSVFKQRVKHYFNYPITKAKPNSFCSLNWIFSWRIHNNGQKHFAYFLLFVELKINCKCHFVAFDNFLRDFFFWSLLVWFRFKCYKISLQQHLFTLLLITFHFRIRCTFASPCTFEYCQRIASNYLRINFHIIFNWMAHNSNQI